MNPPADRDLGMDRAIPRRDFLDGMRHGRRVAAFFGRFPRPPGPPPLCTRARAGPLPARVDRAPGHHPGAYEVAPPHPRRRVWDDA